MVFERLSTECTSNLDDIQHDRCIELESEHTQWNELMIKALLVVCM